MPSLQDRLSVLLSTIVPSPYKERGWVYKDIPGKVTPEVWRELLSILGEGEYKIIVQSMGSDDTGPWIRGQFFISPKAMENLAKFRKERGVRNDKS